MSEQPAVWLVCPICGLFRMGDPPHGQNQPCPEKTRLVNAKIDLIDAQKAHYLAAGFQSGDMVEMIKKMTSGLLGSSDSEE